MKKFLLMLTGTLLMALGLDFFLIPNKIAAGGVSGLATIFEYLFKIRASYSVVLLNIPILLIAFFKVGRRYVFRSIAGTVMLSVWMNVFEIYGAWSTDLFSSSILGGILAGTGMGLVMKYSYTTGGVDVVAGMMNRKNPHLSLGSIILAIDAVVVAASGIIFRSIDLALYAVVSIAVSSKIVDNIVEGLDFAKEIVIISENSEKIAREIMDKLSRGVTGFEVKGMYTNKRNLMLMCIIKKNELLKIEKIVKETDKNAFVILSDVKKVYGEGFENIKI